MPNVHQNGLVIELTRLVEERNEARNGRKQARGIAAHCFEQLAEIARILGEPFDHSDDLIAAIRRVLADAP
jgi:hypothetical protein